MYNMYRIVQSKRLTLFGLCRAIEPMIQPNGYLRSPVIFHNIIDVWFIHHHHHQRCIWHEKKKWQEFCMCDSCLGWTEYVCNLSQSTRLTQMPILFCVTHQLKLTSLFRKPGENPFPTNDDQIHCSFSIRWRIQKVTFFFSLANFLYISVSFVSILNPFECVIL